MSAQSRKVTSAHLQRNAYLYVRQSTLRQVLENTECSQAYGHDRRKSPPGQGPALLQGLAVCGLCGQRMTLRYHTRRGRQFPTHVCQREGIPHAQAVCQSIPGQAIDDALSELLLELMTPLTLEVALAVHTGIGTTFRRRRSTAATTPATHSV